MVEKKNKKKSTSPERVDQFPFKYLEQPKKFLTEHVIEILQLVEILEVFTSPSEGLMHGSNEEVRFCMLGPEISWHIAIPYK